MDGHEQRDLLRHRERIHERLRQGIDTVLKERRIVSTPSGEKVRIPIYDEDVARIRVVPKGARPPTGSASGFGQGPGQAGDVVGWIPEESGSREGRGAGDVGHDPDYWIEMSVEDLAEWVFRELRLPVLEPRPSQEIEEMDVHPDTRLPKGPDARLDKRRSLLNHLRRQVLTGDTSWHDNDLKYVAFRERTRPSYEAAVVFVRDASGSMGEEDTRTVQLAAWWTVQWLRRAYPRCHLHWVIHGTEALETDERTFFTAMNMGGTRISSGLFLGREVLRRYADANRYLVFFSDGENDQRDMPRTLEAVGALVATCDLVGYGELLRSRHRGIAHLLNDWAGGRGRPGRLRVGYHTQDALADWLRTIFGPESG
jgi:uncharacterized sporulation protein YeaH/YhbH (DUF444 family)